MFNTDFVGPSTENTRFWRSEADVDPCDKQNELVDKTKRKGDDMADSEGVIINRRGNLWSHRLRYIDNTERWKILTSWSNGKTGKSIATSPDEVPLREGQCFADARRLRRSSSKLQQNPHALFRKCLESVYDEPSSLHRLHPRSFKGFGFICNRNNNQATIDIKDANSEDICTSWPNKQRSILI